MYPQRWALSWYTHLMNDIIQIMHIRKGNGKSVLHFPHVNNLN